MPTAVTTPRRRQDPDADRWQYQVAASLGIPFRYRTISFENVRRTKAVIVADSYSDLESDEFSMRGVILEGGVGCGKTTAITCAARRIALDFSPPSISVLKFYTFPTLISFLLDPSRRQETLEACIQADELLIDDVGSSYLRRDGMAVGLLEEIIIRREADEAPMLCTTNLPPKKFRELFGDRCYDRLRGEWGAWIDVGGPSLRRKPEPRR